jgi:hypothetical protein
MSQVRVRGAKCWETVRSRQNVVLGRTPYASLGHVHYSFLSIRCQGFCAKQGHVSPHPFTHPDGPRQNGAIALGSDAESNVP